MFDAISFAGGGNRCYWQGGFFEALAERFDLAPLLGVGASAGAWSSSARTCSRSTCCGPGRACMGCEA